MDATYETIGNWIDQSRKGDQDAFAHLVRQYQGMVSGIALSRTGDIHQSEDLAQETFLLAWRKLPELDDVRKFPGWLCSIARNLARNAVRKKAESEQTGTAIEAQLLEAPSKDADPTARLIAAEQHALVASALQNIPEKYREPLVLFYRSEQSVKQIAEVLAISEETAKQRLSRARKFLRGELERRIAGVISASRPGEFFTIAVLAALPVFATAPEVFAATSAAGSASAAAQSSGGSPLLASIWAFLAALLNAIFIPLVIFLGTVPGAWNGIRNSPTLRSRRFMLKATIFQTMMLFSLVVFAIVLCQHCGLFMPLNNDDTMQNPRIVLWVMFLFGWAICVGFYCFFSSYKINRRWRTIVEEDMTQPVDRETLERSHLSLRSLRKFLFCSLAMPLVAFLLVLPATMIVLELFTSLHWWAVFEYTRYIPQIGTVTESIAAIIFLFLFVIVPTLVIFTYVVGMKITDENSLTTWQPKIPNYLQVLTGEEKPKPGLRYRTNLWGDILLVGLGLCIVEGLCCERYFHPLTAELGNQHYYIPVFVIAFIAYLLFAMFFAGIPRKRYFGYIYLGSFIAVLNTVFALFFDPWIDPPAVYIECFTVLPWVSCFILTGVLGLRAFRKRT